MFKILGDKVPKKILKSHAYTQPISKSSKKKKPQIKTTINFQKIFFSSSDIELIQTIYSHSFFDTNFDIQSFRFAGSFLNIVLNIINFFTCDTLKKMNVFLTNTIGLINNLKTKIDYFEFYVQISVKMEEFYNFLKTNKKEETDFIITLSILKDEYL